MDFDDSPEQAEFRAEARDWLAQQTDILKKPEGKITEQDELERAKAWQARKADARYAQITWPEEMGGRGGTP
ncbi:MAG: acyl-CoA dehydrogenase family protein, partial [Alphaproteobacteria bacterium]|nr:acyl-CoA dehydrogenase family protein [Alphaproteobacteria bacterium]